MSGTQEHDVSTGRFVAGLALVCAGTYVFLHAADLSHLLAWDAGLWSVARVRVTTGMVLGVCAFGLTLIYLDPQSTLAWLVELAGLVAFVLGLVLQLEGRLWRIPAPELVVCFGLVVLGVAVFLSSLRIAPSGS